ncbi:MAG TPA: prepilin-type N-terminal cleavage/methylation domain-containing protein [Burkholderiales bacterium]|nr:prepilin-type N-terminal cleavage/methylation domain-containing protein [Burkholderiales bacterium]
MCINRRSSAGFTLVELVLLIVVFSIGLAGILIVINTSVARSADPVLRKQAMAVAESMMEEVTLMPMAVGPGTGARINFDDVNDYNGFATSGIYTINNVAVAGLELYNLNVAVAPANMGGAAGSMITVTVTGPMGTSYALQSFKSPY